MTDKEKKHKLQNDWIKSVTMTPDQYRMLIQQKLECAKRYSFPVQKYWEYA